jgi:hypothetical protein
VDDCIIWEGKARVDGYGRKRVGGRKQVLAHRYVYEREVGPVPEGMTLDHLCRVRDCVNPAHLEPVPFRENVLRGVGPTARNAHKTHCEHGHEFTPENTYRRRDGGRDCRKCGVERTRRYRERQFA